MKKKIILLISAISVLVCMSVHAFGFTDVSGGDTILRSAIEDLCQFDIVDGYEDNTFRPDNLVTRAEMSEFCRRLLPPHVKSANVFDVRKQFYDMNSEHWAADSMGIMIDMGYMQGYGDDTIKPDANVTLGEASAILSRMLGYEAKAKTIGGYPNGYISVMGELDITDSLGAVKANEPLTRSMVVKMLQKTLDAPMLMMTGYDLNNGGTYVQDKNHTYRNLLINYK